MLVVTLANSYWLVAFKFKVKTEKDKIVVSVVKHLVLKLVILRILSHNYNEIITHNPTTWRQKPLLIP